MCGRFALVPKSNQVKYQFNLDEDFDFNPRYNIAPGSKVLFLCAPDSSAVKALNLHWGLIPFWAKDKKISGSLANARAETIFEKPAFRQSIKSKRGIMVMSGFYEWHTDQGVKQPFYFKQQNDSLLAVAAIWDSWQSEHEIIHSCCLITTSANALMKSIHQRMPVILSKAEQKVWMNNQECNTLQLMELMHPYRPDDLTCYPVTTAMSNSRYESDQAIIPLNLLHTPIQTDFFDN
jgi:putative SOS response-associated peptidase YedK